ncbi:hypothetical protein AMS68_005379 [Peltaster fructicola]|uniref:GH16 domain-containing protein n=1 Tax=Peltaster fructicola TaxID=286661 RepID=A0A6H0XYL0_9PEZI|nr:hypothetical protein AMS68_005379 [Peltaster fructicola]
MALILSFAALAATQAIIAPKANLTVLQHATDSAFGGFISDGGAGGFVSQYNLSIFSISDGSKCKQAHFDNLELNDTCSFPVHTAYAGIDYSDPTKLNIIANYTEDFFYRGQGGEGLVPWNNVTDPPYGIKGAGGFAPAPHTAAIPIPGNSTGLLNVWPVYANETKYVFTTMFEMNFYVDANYLNALGKQVPVQRTVPVLFDVTKNITDYGSAMLTSGRGSEANTHFYLWAGDSTGWKVARAPWATRTDTSTYSFWHGQAGWQNTPLRRNNDTYGNVYNFTANALASPGTWGSDIRWVDRFQTYVLTYQAAPIDFELHVQYSKTGAITGPYTDPVTLAVLPLDNNCTSVPHNGTLEFIDFMQVHWDYYGLNDNRTLVSWISCTNYQNMGILNWTTGYNNYTSPGRSYKGV